MRAFIIGITGQDGSYLAELLLSKGYVVGGLLRQHSNSINIDHFESDIHLYYGDVRDDIFDDIFDDFKPDEIYNLAGNSDALISNINVNEVMNTCGLSVLLLLESIRKQCPQAKVCQASSAEVFYSQFSSIYSISKLTATLLVEYYRKTYNIYGSNAFLFNHESPRRKEKFVTRKIINNLVSIKHKQKDCVYLGNLDARRDWGYAPEFVEAMWLMLQQDKPDDYVIATGKSYSVRQFCEITAQQLDMDIEWRVIGEEEVGIDRKTSNIIIRTSTQYYRDTVDRCGDISATKEKIGWEPRWTLYDIIRTMVNAEMDKYKKKM